MLCRVCSIGCIDDTALDACLALAGAYFGDRSVCVDISCDTTVTLGACCVDEICSLVTSTTCSDASGTYQGNNTFCSSNTCDPPPTSGACCTEQACTIQTEDDCLVVDGLFRGENTTCFNDPCLAGSCCANDSCF